MTDPTTPDTLTAAAERAWTGRQLLAWLQQHPQWLDRPVELVEMAEDGDAPGARYLTLAESDQASDESWVISLCAWPEKPMEPPAPTPPVDRDGLIDYVRAAVDRPGDERDEEVVDALLTAGYVTTRARVVEREDGAALITAERQRQVEAEGWTAEHDDEHDRGQLAKAAACYSMPEHLRQMVPMLVDERPERYKKVPSGWPWAANFWKPTGDRVRDLTKAAALYRAEVDRIERVIDRLRRAEEADHAG